MGVANKAAFKLLIESDKEPQVANSGWRDGREEPIYAPVLNQARPSGVEMTPSMLEVTGILLGPSV